MQRRRVHARDGGAESCVEGRGLASEENDRERTEGEGRCRADSEQQPPASLPSDTRHRPGQLRSGRGADSSTTNTAP